MGPIVGSVLALIRPLLLVGFLVLPNKPDVHMNHPTTLAKLCDALLFGDTVPKPGRWRTGRTVFYFTRRTIRFSPLETLLAVGVVGGIGTVSK